MKGLQSKLKTDNLCSPRIGPGYIKNCDTYNKVCLPNSRVSSKFWNFKGIFEHSCAVFREEETIAATAAAAIACD